MTILFFMGLAKKADIFEESAQKNTSSLHEVQRANYTGIWGYISIARPDHWFKNIFVVPGVLVALFFYPSVWSMALIPNLIGCLAVVCIIASSNYVINEILDAKTDQHHPVKKYRPIPAGNVSIPLAWCEWACLSVIGIVAGYQFGNWFGNTALLFWCMGLVYNVPPLRFKEVAYLDVITESFNNPIRLLLGWYATGLGSIPSASIIFAYWMFGAFLMAMKRFAEYRKIGDKQRASSYRSSFAYYDEVRLLGSIVFYTSLFAMFSAVFIARYKLELLLACPFVAFALSYYFKLGFEPDSPVQYPERLYTNKKLMLYISAAVIATTLLLFTELPLLHEAIYPWHKPHSI